MKRFLGAISLCVFLFTTTVSHAAEVVLQPGPDQGKDVWVTSVFSDFGQDDENLRAGGWGDLYYSLIEFDLNGLPQEATSAKLLLRSIPHPDSRFSPVGINVDRVLGSWDETTKWQTRPPVTTIQTNLPAPMPGTWYEIDITSLYNDWQSGAVPNHGIQLRPTGNNANQNLFWSSDHTEPGLRPKLVIEYDGFAPQRELFTDRPVDTNVSTVVLTHGFQLGNNAEYAPNYSATAFSDTMYKAVDNRLTRSNIDANVFAFMWEDAFVNFIGYTPLFAESAGTDLATQLIRTFGPDYTENNDIHFIGHSYGTLVNAHAVRVLVEMFGWTIDQVTILDAPTEAPFFGGVVAPLEEYYQMPSYPNTIWVDNYYGTKASAYGGPIPGAAPEGGAALNRNHTGVWQWYRGTIQNARRSYGFGNSVVLGDEGNFADRSSPQLWSPPAGF